MSGVRAVVMLLVVTFAAALVNAGVFLNLQGWAEDPFECPPGYRSSFEVDRPALVAEKFTRWFPVTYGCRDPVSDDEAITVSVGESGLLLVSWLAVAAAVVGSVRPLMNERADASAPAPGPRAG